VYQLQLAAPGRRPVLIRPDLQQHQLVSEIRQVLESFLAAFIVEKIRNHNEQARLRVARDKLPDRLVEAARPARLQPRQVIHYGREAMPATTADEAITKRI